MEHSGLLLRRPLLRDSLSLTGITVGDVIFDPTISGCLPLRS